MKKEFAGKTVMPQGTLQEMASNRIYELKIHGGSPLVVTAGEINLFLIESDSDGNECGRTFLASLSSGDWCFPLPPGEWQGRTGRVVAIAATHAAWMEYPATILESNSSLSEEISDCIDAWICRLIERLCSGEPARSTGLTPLGTEMEVTDGAAIGSARTVRWINLTKGDLVPMGDSGYAPVQDGMAIATVDPLWFDARGTACLETTTTEELLTMGILPECLSVFHRLLTLWLIRKHAVSVWDRNRKECADNEFAEQRMYSQLHSLAELIGVSQPIAAFKDDPIHASFARIAQECNLPFEFDVNEDESDNLYERIAQLTSRNRWRMRRVLLPSDFYRTDAGVFIGFRKENASIVVLILRGKGHSLLFDPETGQERPLTREDTASLDRTALKFYDLLPEHKLTWKDLGRFMFKGAKGMFVSLLTVGVISSLIGLVMPVAMEYVTGSIIPSANTPELWQIMILLVCLTAASVLFGLVPQLIMLSFGTSRFERFQAAMCDRLLRLPVNFFRQFDAGDLTNRILAATRIQETLFGVVSNQFLGALFSLGSLIMLFYYSPRLACVAVVVEVMFAGLLLLLYQRNLKPLSASLAAEGRLSGLLIQLIEGMAKIRSSNAEKRVISRYLEDFSTATRADFQSNVNGSFVNMASIVFPGLVSVLFFLLIGKFWKGSLSLPEYMAFMSAYAGFQQGLISIVNDIWTLQSIRPELKRLQPVLEEIPEVCPGMHVPGRLDGKVELIHITFRYQPDGPTILNNVSISAEPGEFIAIVGASGSGKSTLVRLLLGFEKPESGGVYYSNQELSNMDVRAVRRQLGVILQNSKVLPDSILANITKGTDYTAEDAMDALELAAMKEDIQNMPMGIHTLVSDTLISGGQQQRILIARALVGNPAVVIMDESTSALDNATQEIVRKNMEQLRFTRIVIAHRLSTIINADRIYVLDKGRICQVGTYNELINREGVFRQLASRQML